MEPIALLVALLAGLVTVGGLGESVRDAWANVRWTLKRTTEAKSALEDVASRASEIQIIEDGPIQVAREQETQEPLTLGQQDLAAAVSALKLSVSDSKRQIDFNADEQKSASRQQLIYFALSILGTVAGVAIVVYGAYLTLNNQADIGIVTAITGAIPGALSMMLFKRADAAEKRRDASSARTAESVEKAQAMLRVIQMTSRLDDLKRQRILALSVLADMFPDSKPAELQALLEEK